MLSYLLSVIVSNSPSMWPVKMASQPLAVIDRSTSKINSCLAHRQSRLDHPRAYANVSGRAGGRADGGRAPTEASCAARAPVFDGQLTDPFARSLAPGAESARSFVRWFVCPSVGLSRNVPRFQRLRQLRKKRTASIVRRICRGGRRRVRRKDGISCRTDDLYAEVCDSLTAVSRTELNDGEGADKTVPYTSVEKRGAAYRRGNDRLETVHTNGQRGTARMRRG